MCFAWLCTSSHTIQKKKYKYVNGSHRPRDRKTGHMCDLTGFRTPDGVFQNVLNCLPDCPECGSCGDEFYATVEATGCDTVTCLLMEMETNTEVLTAFAEFILCSTVTDVLDEIKEDVETLQSKSKSTFQESTENTEPVLVTIATLIKDEGKLDAIEAFMTMTNTTAQWDEAEMIRDDLEEEMLEEVRPTGHETLVTLIEEEQAVNIMKNLFKDDDNGYDAFGVTEEIIEEEIQDKLYPIANETLDGLFRKEGIIELVEDIAGGMLDLEDIRDEVIDNEEFVIDAEIHTIIDQSENIQEEKFALNALDRVMGTLPNVGRDPLVIVGDAPPGRGEHGRFVWFGEHGPDTGGVCLSSNPWCGYRNPQIPTTVHPTKI